jgi:hypothetical protein
MAEDLLEPPIDYRARALLWAVENCSRGVRDLMAWHPAAADVQERACDGGGGDGGKSLSELLWHELGRAERRALGGRAGPELEYTHGTAATYWLRRQRAAQWQCWRSAANRLPAYWLKLLNMPASCVRGVYTGVGMDMVVCGITGQPSERLIRWLAPLGNDLACRAAVRLREPQFWQVGPDVCDRWREACARAMRLVSGEKVVSTLGRSLLAAIFRRLPERERRDASHLSRSSLPGLLEEDVFLEPVTPEELSVGEQMVRKRLEEADDGANGAEQLEVQQ